MKATDLRLVLVLFSPLKIPLDHNDHRVLGFRFIWCEAQFYIFLSQRPSASDSCIWVKLEALVLFSLSALPKNNH